MIKTMMAKLRPLTLVLFVTMLVLSGCSAAALEQVATTRVPDSVSVKATSKPTQVRATAKPTSKPSTTKLDCTRTLVGGADPKLPSISIADLYRCRPEAKEVVDAIKHNGPFAYDRDDIIFENREEALPDATYGTYHEYTVDTPGASTRGTRRLITSGSRNRQPAKYTVMYYTDDHYDTMWIVVEK